MLVKCLPVLTLFTAIVSGAVVAKAQGTFKCDENARGESTVTITVPPKSIGKVRVSRNFEHERALSAVYMIHLPKGATGHTADIDIAWRVRVRQEVPPIWQQTLGVVQGGKVGLALCLPKKFTKSPAGVLDGYRVGGFSTVAD